MSNGRSTRNESRKIYDHRKIFISIYKAKKYRVTKDSRKSDGFKKVFWEGDWQVATNNNIKKISDAWSSQRPKDFHYK